VIAADSHFVVIIYKIYLQIRRIVVWLAPCSI